MSGYEEQKWRLLEEIDPWGQRRADYRAARIMWYLANANFKNPPSFEKIISMFDFPKTDEIQDDEELEMMFRQMEKASG